jgi:hypothetical protein
MRTLAKALLTVALLLSQARVASATTCFVDGTGAFLVAHGFTIPGKGACTTFKGYYAGTSSVAYGAACGTSDGLFIRGTLSVLLGQLLFSVDRAALQGSIRSCSSTGCESAISLTKVRCSLVPTGFL